MLLCLAFCALPDLPHCVDCAEESDAALAATDAAIVVAAAVAAAAVAAAIAGGIPCSDRLNMIARKAFANDQGPSGHAQSTSLQAFDSME